MSTINARGWDLENNVSSVSSSFRKNTSIDATASVDAWAVSVGGAPASAVHDGKVAVFADRQVKRLRVV